MYILYTCAMIEYIQRINTGQDQKYEVQLWRFEICQKIFHP